MSEWKPKPPEKPRKKGTDAAGKTERVMSRSLEKSLLKAAIVEERNKIVEKLGLDKNPTFEFKRDTYLFQSLTADAMIVCIKRAGGPRIKARLRRLDPLWFKKPDFEA
ncbi:hypothetical protein HY969_02885 [Candidatus Kaiserbacteria bacterium]|nr:hypothetical protein [Candidatus Kaiserbacteria bacterium]